MLICPRVYFCTLFPNLQLLLAALTALTFRHSPLPPATLWAGFLSALQRLQGPCTKSRNLSNSTRQSFPHPAGAKATSSCRAAASRAPGTAAPPRGFSESSWLGCFPSPLCRELFSLTFLSPVPGNRNGARCCSCYKWSNICPWVPANPPQQQMRRTGVLVRSFQGAMALGAHNSLERPPKPGQPCLPTAQREPCREVDRDGPTWECSRCTLHQTSLHNEHQYFYGHSS